MTMTPERLAELDAVMANTTKREWSADGLRDNRIVWSGPDTRVCFMAIYPKAHADSLAIVALHNAYTDLRAHIDEQAATIARQDEALNIAHTAFADCDQSNPMQVEAIAIVRAALTGAA